MGGRSDKMRAEGYNVFKLIKCNPSFQYCYKKSYTPTHNKMNGNKKQ